jgi:uncharacterized protein (TIGR02444 family)
MGNEFWTFSLATYAAEGVAECCLAVQDEMGLDVNVLLYATWLASRERKMTEAHLAALEACIRPWRQRVVLPLRALRNALRDYPDASLVREGVKELELQSEQQQQNMMWEFCNSMEALPLEKQPLEGNLSLLVQSLEICDTPWNALRDQLARVIGV